MYIQRDRYLKRIQSVTGKQVIKVLTGMRRVGKTTILKQVQEQLRSEGVPETHIISLNFELMEYESIRDHRVLYDLLTERMMDEDCYYVFLDEVQEVRGFERVVNSLYAGGNVELFITGSNSNLLSGELATYLTGRYFTIEVLPLSFDEIFPYIQGVSREDKFLTFLRFGGMPGILQFDDSSVARNYLLDMYQSILLRDIVQRHSIRNVDLLKRFFQYILSNTGQLFSASSITRYLKNEGRRLSKETIYQYLEAAKEAFLFYGVPRYDIKGKEALSTNEKYFINDLGFRGLFFNNELNIGQALENVIYLHLRARGYELFVGKLDTREVDFIAIRAGEKLYIQVAYLLAEPSTIEREFSPLEAINDNYPKLALSLDPVNRSRNGIVHRNIIEYLLSDE
ncbi:MAG: ATP-binding protein [Sphaerochaetaceae bacterium]|nr:ATP-binding protein [Sphaerochaetaceae bacterium]